MCWLYIVLNMLPSMDYRIVLSNMAEIGAHSTTNIALDREVTTTDTEMTQKRRVIKT